MAQSFSLDSRLSLRRVLLWSPPPRAHGSSRVQLRTEAPQSPPLSPKSEGPGRAASSVSQPGSGYYEIISLYVYPDSDDSFSSSHSDTWSLDPKIAPRYRELRRKDSWSDGEYFLADDEKEKISAVLNGTAAPREEDTGTDVEHGERAEKKHGKCGAFRTHTPGPGTAPRRLNTDTARDQLPPNITTTDRTYPVDEMEFEVNGPVRVHDITIGAKEWNGCPELTFTSPDNTPNHSGSRPTPIVTGSPSISSSGRFVGLTVPSSLRATAPCFSPAELGAWPHSPSSFSPSPEPVYATVDIPPVSPALSQATPRVYIAKNYTPTTIVPMDGTPDNGNQWDNTPTTVKVTWPAGLRGQPVVTAEEDELDRFNMGNAKIDAGKNTDTNSLGGSKMEGTLPSDQFSAGGNNPYSCIPIRSIPTPDKGCVVPSRDGKFHGGAAVHHSNNFQDLARAPPTAPRAMRPRSNAVQLPESWTNSKTWVSEEEQKRQEFHRAQEQARHNGLDKDPSFPRTFKDYLEHEVQEIEANRLAMEKKIKDKENEMASNYIEENFGPQIRAGVAAVLESRFGIKVFDDSKRDEGDWPSRSEFKFAGDNRAKNGLDRVLPPPANMMHLSTIIGGIASHQPGEGPMSHSHWMPSRDAAEAQDETQEISLEELKHETKKLVKKIDNWIDEIESE